MYLRAPSLSTMYLRAPGLGTMYLRATSFNVLKGGVS